MGVNWQLANSLALAIALPNPYTLLSLGFRRLTACR
jgi:hypothetical protein